MSTEGDLKLEGSKAVSTEVEDTFIADDISLSSMQPVISGDEHPNNEDKEHLGSLSDRNFSEEDPVDSELQKYHVACQKGDLATVSRMVEEGLVDIKCDHDNGEGVTGLHWASINNKLSIVNYLVAKGADLNAKAGTLHAPPIHWAARYGYVYIVDYLLRHGADATLTDDQGFNLLHISVNSSNIMLVLYVLFFVVDEGIIDINSQDPHGRSSLLWASYQGDSLTVDALLRFGAYVKIADQGGFTPIHWGTLKGQPHVLMYLIQQGADFFQKTNDGKDCFTIAQEMNTVYSLNEALRHCGFDGGGYPVKKYFSKSLNAKIVTFLVPWMFLGVAFSFLSHIHILFSFPVLVIFGLALRAALKRYVLSSYNNIGVTSLTFFKTPLYAGIFSGSVFWVVIVWLTKILPSTATKEPIANVVLLLSITAIGYLFITLLRSDPGRVPAETNHDINRRTIEELLKLGLFDMRHFCIETWIRKPLRSKFSTLNNALVARFDHFCPWVYNDIGLLNHKVFIYFITSVEFAIWLFAYLCYEYFDNLEDYFEDKGEKIQCFIISDDDLCAGFTYDLFTSLVLIWALFQAIWLGFVILVQFFQIFKGITNYEFSKLMKERKGISMDPMMFNEFFNTTPEDFATVNENIVDSSRTHSESMTRSTLPIENSKKCCGFFCAITGMDQWLMVMNETLGIAQRNSGMSESSPLDFSTNYGWKTNAKDFWLISDTTAPLWQRMIYSSKSSKALLAGTVVDYYKLYKLPVKILDDSAPLDV